jgi:REP element-mobilizing transposase RayT
VVDGEMVKNEFGGIVWDEWRKSATIREEIELDEFVIMPNHVHGIVFIAGATGRSPLRDNGDLPGARAGSIGAFMAGFKSVVSKRINQIRNTPGIPVWQRNYYEHVIRNDEELNHIRKYVTGNPMKWAEDEDNPFNMTL